MAVITISRQFGSGGWTLGQRLSKRLGYHYVDERMIREVAKEAGTSPEQIRSIEKEGSTKLMKFLNKFVSRDFIDRLISEKYRYLDEERYVEVVRTLIRKLHEEDNVVIIGRGSQFVLRDYENTLHVLLVNHLEDRIEFIMNKYKRSREDARRTVRQADEIRHHFLSFFAEPKWHDDPISYDVCFNTKRTSLDKVEDAIAGMI